MTSYPVGTRVRRTIVTEGVVIDPQTATTDDGQWFWLPPRSDVGITGKVTIEVLAPPATVIPPEPPYGAICIDRDGDAWQHRDDGWWLGGEVEPWTWAELHNTCTPIRVVFDPTDDEG